MNAFDLKPVLPDHHPGIFAVETNPPLYIPAKPLTEKALCDWIGSATAGERIQYHHGLLLVDRSASQSTYPVKEQKRIRSVAERAWRACELGLVHLVSRRIAPYVFAYIAVRSLRTPTAPRLREQPSPTSH
jgi:hypothetical protein